MPSGTGAGRLRASGAGSPPSGRSPRQGCRRWLPPQQQVFLPPTRSTSDYRCIHPSLLKSGRAGTIKCRPMAQRSAGNDPTISEYSLHDQPFPGAGPDWLRMEQTHPLQQSRPPRAAFFVPGCWHRRSQASHSWITELGALSARPMRHQHSVSVVNLHGGKHHEHDPARSGPRLCGGLWCRGGPARHRHLKREASVTITVVMELPTRRRRRTSVRRLRQSRSRLTATPQQATRQRPYCQRAGLIGAMSMGASRPARSSTTSCAVSPARVSPRCWWPKA